MDKFTQQTSVNIFFLWLRRFILVVAGLLVTLSYFLILPLLGHLGHPPAKQMVLRSADVVDEPPPPPLEEEEEKKEEESKPKLEENPEPLDLSELELALNPDAGSGWDSGDFTINLDKHLQNSGSADSIFSMAELDQKPRAIFRPNPRYPQGLQQQGIEGTVHVVFMVSKNGRVEKAKVQKSTHPAFAQEALQAVEKWKFEPGRRKGQPVPFRMRVPITFSQG